MARPTKDIKYTKAQFLQELLKNNGNAYRTYTALQIPYSQYRLWLKDESFAEEVKKSREKTTEFVVDKFMEKLESGNLQAILFYLKTQGGWSEKKDVRISTDSTIDVNAAIESIKQDLKD